MNRKKVVCALLFSPIASSSYLIAMQQSKTAEQLAEDAQVSPSQSPRRKRQRIEISVAQQCTNGPDNEKNKSASKNENERLKDFIEELASEKNLAVSKINPETILTDIDGAGFNPNAPVTAKYGTLLHVAAYHGLLTLVQKLVDLGAFINIRNTDNRTPLYSAAGGGYTDMAQFLLEKGAEAEVRANENITPLHVATHAGHADIVTLLLNAGARVDTAMQRGSRTALHSAAYNDHTEIVRILLARSADPYALTSGNKTALDLAETQEIKDLLEAAMAKQPRIIKIDDIAFPADIQLLMAASAGKNDVVTYLCKKKLVNIRSCPLLAAINAHQKSTVELLLEQGASLEESNHEWNTPLHLSLLTEQPDIAELLINKILQAKRGDLLNRTNKKGETPLTLALPYPTVQRLLSEQEAQRSLRISSSTE